MLSKFSVYCRKDLGCCSLLFESFLVVPRGWKTYASQSCAFAGIGLSCLYMTVIGFDNVTSGKFLNIKRANVILVYC